MKPHEILVTKFLWDIICNGKHEFYRFIDAEREQYELPKDDPEIKMGIRFKSNNRIFDFIHKRFMEDLDKGNVNSMNHYVSLAFDKMCELDWHYSNKEKWQ